MPGKTPPAAAPRMTLSALARHLGLSTTTISVVMNAAPASRNIPAATRERILNAARALNYRPNYMARSLRGSRSMTIGLLATESSEGYFTLVMSGIEQALMPTNYFYFSALHYGRQDLVNEYTRLLGERAVDGLLLISTPLPAHIDRPMVTISGHATRAGVTNIALDHHKAAVLALTYLKELGHRRIAFLRGQSFNVDTDDRWCSILEVARELDIAIDPDLCVMLELHSWSPQTGYVPVQELLTRRRDFTAIFCFNDISALGAIRALHEAGLSVPNDISVLGFDDIAGGAFSVPGLTTVRQPLVEMGKLGAETLLARIECPNEAYPEEILMQPSLTLRESVQALPKAGKR